MMQQTRAFFNELFMVMYNSIVTKTNYNRHYDSLTHFLSLSDHCNSTYVT